MKEETKARFAKARKEREDHKKKLEQNYDHELPDSRVIMDALYDKAWEDGHSCGLHEVESHYGELVDLVGLVWEEARRKW